MQKAPGMGRTTILQVVKALQHQMNHFDNYDLMWNCNDHILIVEKQSFQPHYRY
jgi:hypothetical protein